MYKIDKFHEHFLSEPFGYWNTKNGLLDLRETKIVSKRRRDLREKVLKSIIIITDSNSSIGHLGDRW